MSWQNGLSWFISTFTTGASSTGRVKVDSQQTSFEQNRQFRFFDDLSGADEIPLNSVLIYEFTTVNPITAFDRTITAWSGGRKYLVYPNNGTSTITGGTWSDVTSKIFNINGLLGEGVVTHPVTGVTIRKRIATGFSSTATPSNGTAYKSDASNSRATDSFSPDGTRSGAAAGASFLLVFTNIAVNDPSDFLYSLSYEETFS